MPLLIIKPGLLDLIQDCGRYGYSEFGINPGGAMDRFAATIGNSLVGNSGEKAVLEIHFPGPQALFTEHSLISITGADFEATVNDEPLPLWHPVLIRKNSLLQFHSKKKGARAYLAVHSGFYMDKWLDSFSTHLKGCAGGWKGRKLEKGDELPFGYHENDLSGCIKNDKDYKVLPWSPDVADIYAEENIICFLPGLEWPFLHIDSQHRIKESSFQISTHSDRMGYHLTGSPLSLNRQLQAVSTPVSFGTIQLLPGGQMIILMADHQTTGGYPRVGHVISAHLPKLAQLSPGDNLQFKTTDLVTAESLYVKQLKEMENLHYLCSDHLNKVLCAK